MSTIGSNSISRELIRFFTGLTWKDLPPEVQDRGVELVTDLVGVGLGGSIHPEGEAVYRVMSAAGGASEAVVWGRGDRIPAHAAALVNGTFSHCLELDDTHRQTYLHAGAVVVPAATALGQKEDVGGEAFLLSVVAGYETDIRVALSVSPDHRLHGWHTTATAGVYGAAMTGSLLLGLDKKQGVNALGLAGTQAAGLFQFGLDGSSSKRFHPGRSAQSGVLAAQFAREGMTGSPHILEGDYGFGKVMSPRFEPGVVLRELGRHWHILEMGIKPYAACRFCHAPIEGALAIRAQAGFSVDKIKKVAVSGSQQLHEQTGNRRPETVMGAQLSTPFAVALALVAGKNSPQDVERGLTDPQVMALAQRVQVAVNTEIAVNSREIEIFVEFQDGRKESRKVALPLGEPEKPLGRDFLKAKFLDLAGSALGSRPAADLYDTLQACARLKTLDALCDKLYRARKTE